MHAPMPIVKGSNVASGFYPVKAFRNVGGLLDCVQLTLLNALGLMFKTCEDRRIGGFPQNLLMPF
jgi:hypothetical protein